MPGRLATPIAKQWAKNSSALVRYLLLRPGKNNSEKDRKSLHNRNVSSQPQIEDMAQFVEQNTAP